MKNCKYCGTPLENDKNTFCDRSCSAKHNNPIYRVKTAKLCLNCGTPLTNRESVYCSMRCFGEYKFNKKTLQLFYDGKIERSLTLRKILTYLFGDKCGKCGMPNVWNGDPLTLEVHHIDGNSDNNFPNNLQLLCPNCHSQTGTFNGKSKNTKRNKYFRDRYNTAIV